MNADAPALLEAERRGRAIVLLQHPGPGSEWRIDALDDGEGYAFLAAARIASSLGAAVTVRLGRPKNPSPLWQVLAESAERQGLVIAGAATANRLLTANPDGGTGESFTPRLPDAVQAWRLTLGQSHLLVRKAEATDAALSTAACRQIDALAMQKFGVPGLCLMENAAVGGTAVAMDMLHGARGRTVIVAGGGNNAGDGFAMARGLWELGLDCEVALLKPAQSLKGDAAINYRLLREAAAVPVHELADTPEHLAERLNGAALIVDALLGTGFSGRLSAVFASAVAAINASGIQTLGVDIPSGLNGDTGAAENGAVRCDRTATFAAVKTGLLQGAGPVMAGTIYLAAIGAPAGALGIS